MKPARIIVPLILLALFGAACAGEGGGSPLRVEDRDTGAPASGGGDENKPAAGSGKDDGKDTGHDFTVETFDGKTFTMSDHRGSPVVLNFWESWCPQCQAEQPDLNEVFERYGGEVVFIGVSNNDTVADGEAYQVEYGVPYPLAHAPKVWEQFEVPYQPVTAVFDGAGEVVGSVDGPISEATLVDLIEQALDAAGAGS
jgi:cytochrome c biogenesis protein CcmG/thiol:disulfide interchange protein DsbE